MEQRLVEAWKTQVGRNLNGNSASLQASRRDAIERFEAIGFPAKKSEAWKYTNISRALASLPDLSLEAVEALPDASAFVDASIPGAGTVVLAFANGRFAPELSVLDGLQNGVLVTDLQTAANDHSELFERHFENTGDAARDGFLALNTAFAKDGLFIHVSRGTAVESAIQIVHLFSENVPTLAQPRMLVVAEENAQVRIVESSRIDGGAELVTNAVAEFVTATAARVDHLRIVDEHESSIHVHNLRSYQSAGSYFATNSITLSRGTVRNQAYFLPDGENCETHLAGFYLAQGNAHIDNHTLVDHAKPECYSNELFKGVLDDTSTGVFNGKVLVRQDAQKINAYQTNRSVVLTDTARMYSKPELEIYADDVRCSHGATTGELDDDAMFYLRARGIREHDARMILLEAFAAEVMDRIEVDAAREYVDARVRDRIANK